MKQYLTNGLQNSLIHGSRDTNVDSNMKYSIVNTSVFARIKIISSVCFWRIKTRHLSVLLRIKWLSWYVSVKFSYEHEEGTLHQVL